MKKISLNIDTKEAQANINDLVSDLNTVKTAIDNQAESSDELGDDIENLKNRYADLSSKLLEYERITNESTRALQSQTNSTTLANQEAARLNQSFISIAKNAGTKLAEGAKQAATALTQCTQAVNTLFSSFSDGSSEMQVVEKSLSSVTNALSNIAKENYAGAVISLVSSWKEFGTLLGFSSEELEKFRKIVVGVGNSILQFLIAPIKSFISLVRGDFAQAKRDLEKGFEFKKNYKDAIFNQEIKQAFKDLGDSGVDAWKRIKDAAEDYYGRTLDKAREKIRQVGDDIADSIKKQSEEAEKAKKIAEEALKKVTERMEVLKASMASNDEAIAKSTKNLEKAKKEQQEILKGWKPLAQEDIKRGSQPKSVLVELFGRSRRREREINYNEDLQKDTDRYKKLNATIKTASDVLNNAKVKSKEYKEELEKLTKQQEKYAKEVDDSNQIIKEAEEASKKVAEEQVKRQQEFNSLNDPNSQEFQERVEKENYDKSIEQTKSYYEELARLQEAWNDEELDNYERQIKELEAARDRLKESAKQSKELSKAGGAKVNEGDADFFSQDGINAAVKIYNDRIEQIKQAKIKAEQEAAAEEQRIREEQEERRKEEEEAEALRELENEHKLAVERERIWDEFDTARLSDENRLIKSINQKEQKYLDSLDKSAQDYESKKTQITEWAEQERAAIRERYAQQETVEVDGPDDSLANEWAAVYKRITDSRLSEEQRAINAINEQEQAWIEKFGSEYPDAVEEIEKYATEQRAAIHEQYLNDSLEKEERQGHDLMESITDTAAGASGAVQTVIGTFSLLGVEMGNDLEVLKKLQSVMSITSGITAIQKGIIGFKKLGVAISGAAKSAGKLKTALISTGIGALIVLIGILIANLDKIKEKFFKVGEETRRFTDDVKNLSKSLDAAKQASDFEINITMAGGNATAEQIRQMKDDAIALRIAMAQMAEDEALKRYTEKVKELGDANIFTRGKIRKEIEALKEAYNTAAKLHQELSDQAMQQTLDNVVEKTKEQAERAKRLISAARTLIEGRLSLDIAQFEHLRSVINQTYTDFQNFTKYWSTPDTEEADTINDYAEQLKKLGDTIETYNLQLNKMEETRAKRRQSLYNELYQRYKDQQITWGELQQQLKQFDSSEVANADTIRLQVASLLLEYTSLQKEEQNYRKELKLTHKQQQDNIDNTKASIEAEMEYRKSVMNINPNDWWNEWKLNNSSLQYEKEQLDLQKEIYNQELDNLKYQLDQKLIAQKDYYEKVAEIQANITRNEQDQAEVRVAIEQNAIEEKKLVNQIYYRFLQDISGSISSILGSVSDTLEEGTNEWKALRYAQTIIDTLAGSIAAYVSALTAYPAPYNMIAGAAQAAAVVATGIATAHEIANTEVSKDSTTSTATINYLTTNISNVRQTTTRTDYDELRDNTVGDMKVYVLESDITMAQRKKKVSVQNATF